MKNIISITAISLILSSCTGTNLFNFNSKSIDEILKNQSISGESNDSLGNRYIATDRGSIIKVDKNMYITETKENVKFGLWNSPASFFYIDKNENGYLLPTTITTGLQSTIIIHEIKHLKVTNTYDINIQGSGYKVHCLSEDNCSDLYINVGEVEHSLNNYINSGKIKNNNLS